ncbi:hypothetical protein JDV02_009703 [Purpureocillium takamizusanense]|uniref:Uncharacterized protein n=1 Tax=Purpureocillium takamizusanense TaxID=2060973 RepID=A0A9Q8VGL1_9HYPO|nr:uncharacterized protein JDV02_009703 [Purpureocillium takamizusanense]UNI23912.1 hypothetical protein JDV02_009703 [Purpureocillium takamizusanense]
MGSSSSKSNQGAGSGASRLAPVQQGQSGSPPDSSHTARTPMRPDIRRQILETIQASLHDVPYAIIGGTALAEHGGASDASEVDVLLGKGVSKASTESLLMKRSSGRMVRRDHGRFGFVWRDGTVFPIHLVTDVDLILPLDVNADTQIIRGTRIATLVFMLNSKAHAWQNRDSDREAKRERDARDIVFCLKLLRAQQGEPVDPKRLNWVYNKNFWNPFLAAFPDTTVMFRDAGLSYDG